jgi:hypothetical protein
MGKLVETGCPANFQAGMKRKKHPCLTHRKTGSLSRLFDFKSVFLALPQIQRMAN